jgi:hypothetical protein
MAETTPDSELGSIECFQNYTAPEVFVQGLAGLVNQQDVEAMIRAQKQMYGKCIFYNVCWLFDLFFLRVHII